MTKNKVRFGLKNAHYSKVTVGTDGKLTFATPVSFPGAKAINLEPKGEQAVFFADDILYYTSSSNQGYDTTFEVAEIPDEFRQDVLGEVLDAVDKVLTESSTSKTSIIALLFEFDGDVKATRHVLYYCSVSRPGIASETKGTSAEPGTTELKLVAAPRPDNGVVKRSTTVGTTAAVYDAWYTKVYEKAATPAV